MPTETHREKEEREAREIKAEAMSMSDGKLVGQRVAEADV